MKLSAAQIAVLERLANPGEFLHYMHWGLDNYFSWNGMKGRNPNIRTVFKLHDLGLVDYRRDSLGYPSTARITDAGRKALEVR